MFTISFIKKLFSRARTTRPSPGELPAPRDFLERRTNQLSSADFDPANAANLHRYEQWQTVKASGDQAAAAALLAQSSQPPSIYKGHYRELFKIWRAMNRKDLKARKYVDVVDRVTTMIRFDDEMIDVMLKHWRRVQRRELPEGTLTRTAICSSPMSRRS